MSDPPTPSRRPAQVAPAETPGLQGPLTVAVAVVAIAGLYLGRSVLIPLTLAMLLCFMLAPLVNLLQRVHLGRVPSVLLAMLLALMVILALGGLIGTQVAGLAEDMPRYAATIQHKVDTVQQAVLSHITAFTNRLVHNPGLVDGGGNTQPGAAPAGPASPATPSAAAPIPMEVHQADQTMVQLVQRIATSVAEPLSTMALVVTIAIFMLLQREDLRDRMIRLFGSSDLHRTTVAINDAGARLSHYLLSQLAVNTAFGVIIGAGLALIGIPSPVMWGILAGLLRFVPYIGAPLSSLMPLALAAAIDPGWHKLLWTAVLYLGSELTMGNVVEPQLYSHSTGLSPFAVVLAATFWTWLWGPTGLILSTPLTLCLVVLGRHVARLEFLDVLLGDSPALTPVESFYQRMLAGDLDEVHDHAEDLLKQQSLASYYDDVALQALRLAAVDTERGVLTPDDLERIRTSIQSLIGDLDHHEDRQPPQGTGARAITVASGAAQGAGAAPGRLDLAPAWGGTTPVLCIAGNGLLDEAVAAMLAQLLGKQGLATGIVPEAATARDTIDTLGVSGVAMVCIACLEPAGTPSYLRNLVQRLRRHLPPGIPILVGIRPVGDEILHDDQMRAAVGADYYATSLREAVAICLDVAQKATVDAQPQPVAAATTG